LKCNRKPFCGGTEKGRTSNSYQLCGGAKVVKCVERGLKPNKKMKQRNERLVGKEDIEG